MPRTKNIVRTDGIVPTKNIKGIDRLLTAEEVAEILGVHPNSLPQWRYRGLGPAWVKVGVKVRYRPEDVRAWIEERIRTSTHGCRHVH
ncbi:helix-turn-helix transcriptional regulator [Streptomyces chitinivorans]|uniref:Helix-turn-helix transcriptional regulator n=1 Tax=Streptomyces chitinivorans TaxID=1257027 RepID=A0ABW7HM98_9ACTN|nr:helix-turn-helix domain-containing protein [Streptomyces chitinivorans]MDH2410839.1 helix-turn-helix domain-containing protein [Streptomyces chitinivorans]